jgi:ubiquinone/menaquinone biosynthesis C-methylase UbiE
LNIKEYKKMFRLETTYWWFVGKQELVIDLLKGLTNKKKAKILDIGCGTGGCTRKFTEFGNVVAIDRSSYAIRYSKSIGIYPLIKCDGQNLCLKRQSFDFVFLLDVLEHLQDDKTTMREVSRILKQNGFCIVTVPAFKFLWSTHDKSHHHFRRYDIARLKKIAHPILNTERISYWNFSLLLPVTIMRLFFKFISKGKPTKSDLKEIPSIMNKILLSVIRFENFLIRKNINLPFGLSIVCVLRKVDRNEDTHDIPASYTRRTVQ